ncbi:MAG: glycosyltransferase family 1 protein [Phototrophicales bacterium]|nr:MAG: glycosyltransferase family 1 protein [Phototrophicales bacterium]
MHIAINAHLLSAQKGYRQAGIHRYIYGVISHLPKVAPSATFTLLLNHPLIEEWPRVVQRVGMNTSSAWRRIFWEQAIQPLALRQIRPDVYHASAFVMPYGLRVPSVVTVFDLSFVHYPQVLSRSRKFYLQTFTHNSCRRATRIIAISESTKRDLISLWNVDPDKIDVSSVGVDPIYQPLPSDEIEAFRVRKNLPKRFVLFVGTLEPRKNLSMLLRAYAQLPVHVRQDLHLVLGGGKGWLYDDIFKTIEQYQLSETVHTPGYIPSEELVWWYNAADAFVYPTLYEGFGLPIVEAMACGKKVFASDSSSLPEAVGHVGTLLPSDDEIAWTHALQTVYDQYPIPIQQDAIAWAAQFTWQRVAQRIFDSYQQAIT